MQTVDESTMDDVITTVDFATLFSQEELKAKRAEGKDRRKKNRILSVENSHFLIYLKHQPARKNLRTGCISRVVLL